MKGYRQGPVYKDFVTDQSGNTFDLNGVAKAKSKFVSSRLNDLTRR
jgi:hypothetical protein